MDRIMMKKINLIIGAILLILLIGLAIAGSSTKQKIPHQVFGSFCGVMIGDKIISYNMQFTCSCHPNSEKVCVSVEGRDYGWLDAYSCRHGSSIIKFPTP